MKLIVVLVCFAATVYATPVPQDSQNMNSTISANSTGVIEDLPDGFVPAYCHKRYTDIITDTTAWGVKSLVQAPIKCLENEALSQFKLLTDLPKSTFRYEYTCCAVESHSGKVGLSELLNRTTSFDIEGVDSDMRMLERHDVNCGPVSGYKDGHMYAITGFGVEARDGMIRYAYQCGGMYKPLECTNKETEMGDESTDIQFLDRHNVECPKKSFIGRFQYVKANNTELKFKIGYTCCV